MLRPWCHWNPLMTRCSWKIWLREHGLGMSFLLMWGECYCGERWASCQCQNTSEVKVLEKARNLLRCAAYPCSLVVIFARVFVPQGTTADFRMTSSKSLVAIGEVVAVPLVIVAVFSTHENKVPRAWWQVGGERYEANLSFVDTDATWIALPSFHVISIHFMSWCNHTFSLLLELCHVEVAIWDALKPSLPWWSFFRTFGFKAVPAALDIWLQYCFGGGGFKNFLRGLVGVCR